MQYNWTLNTQAIETILDLDEILFPLMLSMTRGRIQTLLLAHVKIMHYAKDYTHDPQEWKAVQQVADPVATFEVHRTPPS